MILLPLTEDVQLLRTNPLLMNSPFCFPAIIGCFFSIWVFVEGIPHCQQQYRNILTNQLCLATLKQFLRKLFQVIQSEWSRMHLLKLSCQMSIRGTPYCPCPLGWFFALLNGPTWIQHHPCPGWQCNPDLWMIQNRSLISSANNQATWAV